MEVAVGCCLDTAVFAVGKDDDIDAGCDQTLTYSFDTTSDTPPTMGINSETGEITWCPDCAEEEHGPYAVVVKVEDDCGAYATTSFTATAYNNPPAITGVEFENEWGWWYVCGCYKVVIEDSKTLHIKVTAEDADDCQMLTFSLNAEDGDPPLPPEGLMYEQVGNEFEIAFNANCYDQCIECESPPDGDKGERCIYDCCDCWWKFIVRVTDGCETEDVCIWVCVADWIND